MPEAESVAAVRAVAETIIPAGEGRPGAAELGVEEHVVSSLEQAMPGNVDLVAQALNGYAGAVREDAAFTELSPEERTVVLRLMSSADDPDIRDAADLLLVLVFGGTYSEWTVTRGDPGAAAAAQPETWPRVGFPGPSVGYPDYREGG